jgi:hypothetical protein
MKLDVTAIVVTVVVCATILLAILLLEPSPAVAPVTEPTTAPVDTTPPQETENLPLPDPGEPITDVPPVTPEDDAVACTMDAMECPDGSFVGRVPPTCEFAACPVSLDTPEDDAQVVCTQDVKQCPDGSYVGRVAPSCEFTACPTTQSPNQILLDS